MSALVWWIIPILALVGSLIVVSYRAQERPGDPRHTVEQRRRFNEAMIREQQRRGRSRRTRRGTSSSPHPDVQSPE
ncbi:MAG TPA: hypothetical protein DHW34_05060 [Actinobacteria bacterium]|nr:hypothetical protein [Actinomycetota bacterium]HCK79365.1 hypothetical protein [Actinomycetota bacterium]